MSLKEGDFVKWPNNSLSWYGRIIKKYSSDCLVYWYSVDTDKYVSMDRFPTELLELDIRTIRRKRLMEILK